MVFLLTFNNIPQNPVNSQSLIVTGLPVFLVVSLAYLGACQESWDCLSEEKQAYEHSWATQKYFLSKKHAQKSSKVRTKAESDERVSSLER